MKVEEKFIKIKMNIGMPLKILIDVLNLKNLIVKFTIIEVYQKLNLMKYNLLKMIL